MRLPIRRNSLLLMLLTLAGCGDAPGPAGENAAAPATVPPDVVAEAPKTSSHDQTEPSFEFAPLSIGSSNADSSTTGTTSGVANLNAEDRRRAIMNHLKPLQVMLGRWRGTTRKEYGVSKAVDSHEWIWDLQSDPEQPGLALKSDKSPYLKTASLTWNPDSSMFELTARDLEGVVRELTGDYTDPVHEIIGPDDKMHRVFRLELTQTETPIDKPGKEFWRMAFAQQENNRYLLEVAKRRANAAFRRFDTVSTQREGTSFALNDSDYGDKTCIISQGLGTIAVTHKGKTFWVCCSGCKAAFEDDPETWIARAEKLAAEQ